LCEYRSPAGLTPWRMLRVETAEPGMRDDNARLEAALPYLAGAAGEILKCAGMIPHRGLAVGDLRAQFIVERLVDSIDEQWQAGRRPDRPAAGAVCSCEIAHSR
jgi:hypothetical protein